MLALLIGAVAAQAQDSPGIIPMPKQPTPSKPRSTSSTKRQPRNRRKPNLPKPKPARTKPAKDAGRSPATGKPGMVKNAIEQRKAAATKAATAKAEAKAEIKLEAKVETKAETKVEAKAEPVDDVFTGIPPAERQKIQAALLWAGDYTGSAGGDDPMLAAIKNFQKRHKAKVTGVLTPSERADLIAAAKAHEDEYGWNVVVDPATGIRIGLPSKLVPQCARRRTWHALVIGAWRGAGRDLPHQGGGAHACCAVRARKERAGHAPGRDAARCMTTISSSAACRA